MATPQDSIKDEELLGLKQSLNTSHLNTELECTLRSVESITRDEDIRKLRFQILLLQDENEELHDSLAQEEERSDDLVRRLGDVTSDYENLSANMGESTNDLRLKIREVETMKAELSSLQGISSDSAKLLAEKLALTRELANMKPELEHLQSQVASHKDLLVEKLSLERQLTTVQAELENEKNALQRATLKEGRASEQLFEYRSQVEDLSKKLSKAGREAEEASTALQQAKEELKNKERAAKKTAAREERQEAELEREAEELRKQLAKEKRHKSEAEKSLRKAQTDWDLDRSSLEERLNTVRTKLKSAKEQLKDKDKELKEAQSAAAKETVTFEGAKQRGNNKNSRKRTVQQADPDIAIGTPGDGLQAKRNKRASTTQPGEKSTFSITPFLNRTTSIVPSSPASTHSAAGTVGNVEINDVVNSIEDDQSPTAPRKQQAISTAREKPKALAPKSVNKPTSKRVASRKSAVPSKLEKVTEEEDQENEAEAEALEEQGPKEIAVPKIPKVTLNPKNTAASRKSLLSFASFNDVSAPEKRKKRRLGGGNALGKTLFDEDDAPSIKPQAGKGFLAVKGFGKSGLLGAKDAVKPGATVLEDGFTFSPLKKDRRAIVSR